MRFSHKLLYLACTTLLASCGGGDSGDTGGGTTLVQQYPAGVWVGTAGPVGGTQQQFIGVIDGGTSNRGGVYYFAKDTGGVGYDGLYGTLSVNTATLRSTGANYFSTVDGKFSTAGITVSGTMTGASDINSKPNAVLSGNYTDPVGTAAATGTTVIPFRMNYSTELTEHASSYALAQGTYRTGGVFGSSSVITIDSTGKVTGTNSGCTLAGQIGMPNVNKGVYSISLGLTGTTALCPATGTTQTGVAVIAYDITNVKTGIWVFTYNASGTKNTIVLNATADAAVPVVPPATTTQIAEGLFNGTVTTSAGNAEDIAGIVLPSNQYFFYRGNAGAGSYDVFYGSLRVATNTSSFTSTNGAYVQTGAVSSGTGVTTGISVVGDVRTRSSLRATFPDPRNADAASTISMTYDAEYTARPANLSFLAGRTYFMSPGFIGKGMTISIDALGAITGTTSDNCDVTGTLSPYSTTGSQNLYNATLNYSGTLCALLARPQQNGVAYIDFDGGVIPLKLNILTASASNTGERYSTVFLGGLVTTP